MYGALSDLGDPHRSYATIHVGGTNGKGSVTATVGSILTASGRRTGCYTSPHLCSFRERFVIDGTPIGEDAIIRYADEIRDTIVGHGMPFFEAVTLLAMHAFAREGVDVGVMEVGLGGRLDATNVIAPEVTAVTNVALDHAEYLGDTLAEIATEKAGIMKEGVPFFTAERSPEILALFERLAARAGTRVQVLEPASLSGVTVSRDHTTLTVGTERWGALELRTPLVGLHQSANAALSVRIVESLADELRPDVEAVIQGVGSVVHPGRDELVRVRERNWLFDVAHNTAGVRTLVDTIDRLELPRPLVALVGVQGDKDWRSMLPALFSRVDAAVLTQPPTVLPERRWDPVSVADQVESLTVVRVVPDFIQAVASAEERAGEGTVVVTGSVHTVGGVMSLLGVDPYGR